MGYSIGYDQSWLRDVGYGVVATCDHPDCNATIDRGLAYVCGGEPFGGEQGCGLYFCSEHLVFKWNGYATVTPQLCMRCIKGECSFDPKPEHPDWIRHVLADESWRQWREENEWDCLMLALEITGLDC